MISKEDEKKIAKLARLKLTEMEENKFQKDLSEILDYFEILKEVADKDIIPAFNPTEEFSKGSFLRKDKVFTEDLAESIIGQFPEKKERHIKVKSIL